MASELTINERVARIHERLNAESDWDKVLEEELLAAFRGERDWILGVLERRRAALRAAGNRSHHGADALAATIVKIRFLSKGRYERPVGSSG